MTKEEFKRIRRNRRRQKAAFKRRAAALEAQLKAATTTKERYVLLRKQKQMLAKRLAANYRMIETLKAVIIATGDPDEIARMEASIAAAA